MEYNLLKYYRQYYHLTQQQICQGICSRTFYSKIENDWFNVDYFTSDALLGRIGKSPLSFDMTLDTADFDLLEMRREIEKNVRSGDITKASDLISDYERNLPEPRLLHLQYIYYWRSKISASPEASLALLQAAWQQTKADFQISANELYNPMEIRIFLQRIHLNDISSNRPSTLLQLNLLCQKIDTYFMGRTANELKALCLWELICLGEKEWDSHRLLAKIDETLLALTPWWSFRFLIDLHRKKAQVLALLMERPGEHSALREQCILECRMVYFAYETLHDIENQQDIVRFCAEKTGADITDSPEPSLAMLTSAISSP